MGIGPIEGVLNVDKPQGLTSHDVVNQVRRIGGIRRVGHAGTLDPLATGVLLLCLGRATRLVEYLVGQPKTYEAVIRLGQTTNTYDAEGEVVAEQPVDVRIDDIMEALPRFRGAIRQRPPLYSAIKKGGRPLYKLARQGIEVEAPLRTVTIYELQLLSWSAPLLTIRVVCSAGTYIRSLAHDLGQLLGCGGHVAGLRRTAVGAFKVETAVPPAELSAENLADFLQPSEAAVQHLPRLDLSAVDAANLQQGQHVARQLDQPQAELVRTYAPAGHFIGVAAAKGPYWRARKMFPPVAGE